MKKEKITVIDHNTVKKLTDEELDKIAGGTELDEGDTVLICQPNCNKKNGGCYDCHFS